MKLAFDRTGLVLMASTSSRAQEPSYQQMEAGMWHRVKTVHEASKPAGDESTGSTSLISAVYGLPADESPLDDRLAPVRQSTARRLGELHAANATGALIDALADPDSLVRVTALGSLQAIHRPALAGLLLDAARDFDRPDRASVVYVLGWLGEARACRAQRRPGPSVRGGARLRQTRVQNRPATNGHTTLIHEEVAR